jgi:hypothetical protein
MMTVIWLLLFATVAVCAGGIWYSVRRWRERQRVEEQRAADFLAQMTGATSRKDAVASPASPAAASPDFLAAPAATASTAGLAQQKLLFDAAHKAGEAGEAALAIQLYGRLLARYPATGFADAARAAVASLKKQLVKAEVPQKSA